MDTTDSESYRAITQEARKMPIKNRANMLCDFLWALIAPMKEPRHYPTILRISRHGIKVAKIAESTYYTEVFTAMKETMERRLSA